MEKFSIVAADHNEVRYGRRAPRDAALVDIVEFSGIARRIP